MRKLLFIALLVSCKNSNYCAGQNPDNNCNENGVIDAHAGSDGNESLDCVAMGCTDGKVCDTSSHACVACIDSSTCGGTSPVCSATETCVACSDFTDCPTTACDSSGACALPTEISYVASAAAGGTVNNLCTQAMPCTSLGTAVGLTTSIIRVKGAVVAASAADLVTMASGTKTIIGENTGTTMASFSTSVIGALFNLSGNANLTIYNLDLTSIGATANGVYLVSGTPVVTIDRSKIEKCSNVAVLAQTGTVNMSRSIVTQNTLGGLDLRSTSFDIENSFVVQNGSAAASFGGISVFTLGSGAHKLDFNTIAKNVGGGTTSTNGVLCSAINAAVTFTNNNIAENTNDTQVSGANCNYAYSNVTGATTLPGNGNRNDNPMFIDDTSIVGNFHLQSGSTLRDKADPGSVLKFDFDSQARPQGNARDIGADELMP